MNRRFDETSRLLAVLFLTGLTGFVARANDPAAPAHRAPSGGLGGMGGGPSGGWDGSHFPGQTTLATTPGEVLEPCLLEKKRVITKTYSVTQRERLYVSNQFGEVRVRLWDKPEVRADIVITATAATDEEAQDLLETVEIDDERQGDQIRLTTKCEAKTNATLSGTGRVWAWADWRTRKSDTPTPAAPPSPPEQRGVKIHYQLSMPRYTALEIKARFSNTFIPEFSAPLIVRSNYGVVNAGQLRGQHNDIRVVYGQAVIKALEKGKLAIEHSKLMLDRAADLELDNKHGNLRIGEVDKLVADLSYSTGQIEALKESARMNLRYLGNFRLPALPASVKWVEIDSQCSDLRLPMGADANLNFNVTVSYADFRAPGDRVIFTKKDEGDDPNGKPQFRKTYIGKVGKGGGTVRITSNYGTVKFVE